LSVAGFGYILRLVLFYTIALNEKLRLPVVLVKWYVGCPGVFPGDFLTQNRSQGV